MRVGSLFSGYGGLDMAVEDVLGGELAWVSDIDKGACKILAHRYPDVPNLGDVARIDWATVEPVEVVTAGFPCQPVSHAGKRAGVNDERWLFDEVVRALGSLDPRPELCLFENVLGLLSANLGDAMGRVIHGLASVGYVGRWGTLRAADVGAPHNRRRVFIVAWPADSDQPGLEGREPAWGRLLPDGSIASHPDSLGVERGWSTWGGGSGSADDGSDASYAASDGRNEGRTEPAWQLGRPDASQRGDDPSPDAECLGLAGRGVLRDLGGAQAGRVDQGLQRERDRDAAHHRSAAVGWGAYEPAVRRWEAISGRPAPSPTEATPKGTRRLSPRFVEWMMGLPAGWVTDVPDMTRNEQLKALGNGVVPQQAAAALHYLLAALSGRVSA